MFVKGKGEFNEGVAGGKSKVELASGKVTGNQLRAASAWAPDQG